MSATWPPGRPSRCLEALSGTGRSRHAWGVTQMTWLRPPGRWADLPGDACICGAVWLIMIGPWPMVYLETVRQVSGPYRLMSPRTQFALWAFGLAPLVATLAWGALLGARRLWSLLGASMVAGPTLLVLLYAVELWRRWDWGHLGVVALTMLILIPALLGLAAMVGDVAHGGSNSGRRTGR